MFNYSSNEEPGANVPSKRLGFNYKYSCASQAVGGGGGAGGLSGKLMKLKTKSSFKGLLCYLTVQVSKHRRYGFYRV